MNRLNKYWPVQVYDSSSKKFRKSEVGQKMGNIKDIMIIHHGGTMVLLSKSPIPGSEHIKTSRGAESYCLYIRYDIRDKQPTFDMLQAKIFN